MSLFEHIAAQDDSERIAQRKASAVANKRVKDSLGTFIANNDGRDLEARLALVDDDIDSIVADVVAEYGGDTEKISAAIKRSLGGGADHLKEYQFGKGDKDDDSDDKSDDDSDSDDDDSDSKPDFGSDDKSDDDDDDDDDDSKESSTSDRSPLGKTARRPKMCPYHSEVVDVSLGSGDPQAGYNALASHAWGDNHCKGGFAGNCNFRPQMVTQKFWDDKQEEYAERARERAEHPEPEVPSLNTEPIMTQEPLEPKPGEGIVDIEGELEEAPSAVGGAELEPALAAVERDQAGFIPCGACNKTGKNQGKPCSQCGGAGKYDPSKGGGRSMESSHTAADAPKGAGGAVDRESLPKGDETALGGPSPKIDKANSGDNNGWTLDDIDTQMENSPKPTITQDVTQDEKKTKADFTDQTDAVTTEQTLPKADESGLTTDRNIDQPHTDTWTGTEGLASPVASTDPDKNPLREIAEAQYDGFVPSAQVQSAIHQYEQS